MKIKFEYDLKYNIAYLAFKERKGILKTLPVSSDINLDFDSDGAFYGIEFLNASEQLGKDWEELKLTNGNTGIEKIVDLP